MCHVMAVRVGKICFCVVLNVEIVNSLHSVNGECAVTLVVLFC